VVAKPRRRNPLACGPFSAAPSALLETAFGLFAPETQPPREPEGPAKFYYPNSATYEGQYLRELKEGEREVPEGPEGDARTKFRHGKGTLVDGDYRYDGDWEEDKMTGKGSFTFASGASYEGDFVDGKYHGKGTYKWADGRVYAGDWASGTMHGQGSYTDATGHVWVGQFYNGAGPGLTRRVD